MPRSVRPLSLAALAGLALALSSSLALASSGLGVIGNPAQVAGDPAAASARVRLTGLFAVGVSGSDPCYSTPQCGTLYYACPPGEEARCEMEWGEMKAAAAAGKCVGFGSPRSSVGTVNNGRVRTAGEPLGEPDVYPLGLGVHVGPCTGLEFACSQGPDVSAARASSCAGASDAGTVNPVPGTGGTTPLPPTAGTGGTGGAPSGSGGASGSDGATAAVDAGGKGETPGKSGCSLAASTSLSSGGLLLLGLSVAIARRRRRDRAEH